MNKSFKLKKEVIPQNILDPVRKASSPPAKSSALDAFKNRKKIGASATRVPKNDDNDDVKSTASNLVQPGLRRMRTGVCKTEDAILSNMKSCGLKRQPTKRMKEVISTFKVKLTKDKKDGSKKINQYVI